MQGQISAGDWSAITVDSDGNEVELRINGEVVDTDPVSATEDTDIGSLNPHMGSDPDEDDFYGGGLDDFWVWSVEAGDDVVSWYNSSESRYE